MQRGAPVQGLQKDLFRCLRIAEARYYNSSRTSLATHKNYINGLPVVFESVLGPTILATMNSTKLCPPMPVLLDVYAFLILYFRAALWSQTKT